MSTLPTAEVSSAPAESFAEMPSREAMAAFLRPGSHLLVTSHARPDGDAVGSMLAMAGVLAQLGITTDLILSDPVPQVYLTLPGVDSIRVQREIDATHYDGAVILECDGLPRTGVHGFGTLPVFNLDHHFTGSPFGSLNWIDWNAAAVAVLVYRLARVLQVHVSSAMATCLYTALFTDTGAFTYPGTASTSFSLAGELIALGADADTVARDVLYSVSAAHIRLLGTALSRMKLRGTVAWSYVTQHDLAEVGATDEDSEGTVTYLISIAGVEAALFLREMPQEAGAPQAFRISLRSKSLLDVSAVATACGGGGHRSAAGCLLRGDLQSIVDRLLLEIDRERSRVTPQ